MFLNVAENINFKLISTCFFWLGFDQTNSISGTKRSLFWINCSTWAGSLQASTLNSRAVSCRPSSCLVFVSSPRKVAPRICSYKHIIQSVFWPRSLLFLFHSFFSLAPPPSSFCMFLSGTRHDTRPGPPGDPTDGTLTLRCEIRCCAVQICIFSVTLYAILTHNVCNSR